MDEWVELSVPVLKQKLLERMANSEAVQRRFWQKIQVGSDPDDCWIWKGTLTPQGYGILVSIVGPHQVGLLAHRISYYIKHRELSNDIFVCHHCDNPLCVNPTHLFLGDQQKNMSDKVEKMRQAFLEKHGRHILTCEQVQQIRVLHHFLGTPRETLATLYRVASSTIFSIVEGTNWKHLPMPTCICDSIP